MPETGLTAVGTGRGREGHVALGVFHACESLWVLVYSLVAASFEDVVK